jgi:hypothetical protein
MSLLVKGIKRYQSDPCFRPFIKSRGKLTETTLILSQVSGREKAKNMINSKFFTLPFAHKERVLNSAK